MSKATESVLGKSFWKWFLFLKDRDLSNSANKINPHNSQSLSQGKEKSEAVRKLELVFCLQIVVIEESMKVDDKYMQKGEEKIMGKIWE